MINSKHNEQITAKPDTRLDNNLIKRSRRAPSVIIARKHSAPSKGPQNYSSLSTGEIWNTSEPSKIIFFDPIFTTPEDDTIFAELEQNRKDKFSHGLKITFPKPKNPLAIIFKYIKKNQFKELKNFLIKNKLDLNKYIVNLPDLLEALKLGKEANHKDLSYNFYDALQFWIESKKLSITESFNIFQNLINNDIVSKKIFNYLVASAQQINRINAENLIVFLQSSKFKAWSQRDTNEKPNLEKLQTFFRNNAGQFSDFQLNNLSISIALKLPVIYLKNLVSSHNSLLSSNSSDALAPIQVAVITKHYSAIEFLYKCGAKLDLTIKNNRDLIVECILHDLKCLQKKFNQNISSNAVDLLNKLKHCQVLKQNIELLHKILLCKNTAGQNKSDKNHNITLSLEVEEIIKQILNSNYIQGDGKQAGEASFVIN